MFPPNLVEACFKQVWNPIWPITFLGALFSRQWSSLLLWGMRTEFAFLLLLCFSNSNCSRRGIAVISLYYSIPHASFSGCLYMGGVKPWSRQSRATLASCLHLIPHSKLGRICVTSVSRFGLEVKWEQILQGFVSSIVLVPLEAV